MLPSLKWATLALSIPLSMADRLAPRVKWEDLMLATSEFPRFFGEVTNLNRTGPPRVVAAQKAEGERWIIMPVKCAGATSEEFHCDYDCPHCGPVAQEFSYPIFQFQNASRPDLNLNNLTFVASNFSETNKSGILSRNFFFTQTNLGGTVEIDNAIVQLNWDELAEGVFREGDERNRYVNIFTGEFHHNSSGPACDKGRARDTAALKALKQPLWDALSAPSEYKVVHTVQDGLIYLAWRVTFNTTDEVGDDFVVWVNARNCSEIIAAAPGSMGLYTKSREDFSKQQVQLFRDRGLPIVEGALTEKNSSLGKVSNMARYMH